MKFPANIIVKNTGTSYSTDILAGNHQVKSDEPVDHGGNDEGPTAHQMLLASLGACTAITIRMYANRKQWDLRSITIELNMEKVISEGTEKTVIFRKLKFEGTLDDEQNKRLLFIADKCPVHKTLTGPVEIKEFNAA